jgi:hypothetical protein
MSLNSRIGITALVPLTIFICANAATNSQGILNPGSLVFLNGTEMNLETPVVSGDVIRTEQRGSAVVYLDRSIAVIAPSTIVRIGSDGVAIDEGRVAVSTGNDVHFSIDPSFSVLPAKSKLAVRVRDLIISPTSDTKTEFEIIRSNGQIVIQAGRGASSVLCGSHIWKLEEPQRLAAADSPDCKVRLR